MINVYLEYFRIQLSKVGVNARSESGASAVEYILIAALIALVVFGVFRALGIQIDRLAGEIVSELEGA